MMACPRCRRHGGMLKPQGRLGNKLLAAKLLYRATGVATTLADEDEPLFDGINPIKRLLFKLHSSTLHTRIRKFGMRHSASNIS